MLKKLFIILFLNLRCDETFRKKLHIYVGGYTKYIKKDKSAKCENTAPEHCFSITNGSGHNSNNNNINDAIRPENLKNLKTVNTFETSINPDVAAQQDNRTSNVHIQLIQHPKIYLVYYKEKSNDEHTNLMSEAIAKSKEIKERHIGATLSVYLFEFKEIISCGLFIGTDHMAEDYIEFTPQIVDMRYNTKNEKKPEQGHGIIFLKRRTPISLGGFVQVQNADLDSFLYALKLNLGVGLTTIHALIKDTDFFTNGKLVDKQKTLIANKISLSLSASIILRYKDLEVFLIGGVSWIPKGAEAKCISADYQPTMNSLRQNGYLPFKRIQNNSVTLNHIYLYIGIGLGWNFN